MVRKEDFLQNQSFRRYLVSFHLLFDVPVFVLPVDNLLEVDEDPHLKVRQYLASHHQSKIRRSSEWKPEFCSLTISNDRSCNIGYRNFLSHLSLQQFPDPLFSIL